MHLNVSLRSVFCSFYFWSRLLHVFLALARSLYFFFFFFHFRSRSLYFSYWPGSLNFFSLLVDVSFSLPRPLYVCCLPRLSYFLYWFRSLYLFPSSLGRYTLLIVCRAAVPFIQVYLCWLEVLFLLTRLLLLLFMV